MHLETRPSKEQQIGVGGQLCADRVPAAAKTQPLDSVVKEDVVAEAEHLLFDSARVGLLLGQDTLAEELRQGGRGAVVLHPAARDLQPASLQHRIDDTPQGNDTGTTRLALTDHPPAPVGIQELKLSSDRFELSGTVSDDQLGQEAQVEGDAAEFAERRRGRLERCRQSRRGLGELGELGRAQLAKEEVADIGELGRGPLLGQGRRGRNGEKVSQFLVVAEVEVSDRGKDAPGRRLDHRLGDQAQEKRLRVLAAGGVEAVDHQQTWLRRGPITKDIDHVVVEAELLAQAGAALDEKCFCREDEDRTIIGAGAVDQLEEKPRLADAGFPGQEQRAARKRLLERGECPALEADRHGARRGNAREGFDHRGREARMAFECRDVVAVARRRLQGDALAGEEPLQACPVGARPGLREDRTRALQQREGRTRLRRRLQHRGAEVLLGAPPRFSFVGEVEHRYPDVRREVAEFGIGRFGVGLGLPRRTRVSKEGREGRPLVIVSGGVVKGLTRRRPDEPTEHAGQVVPDLAARLRADREHQSVLDPEASPIPLRAKELGDELAGRLGELRSRSSTEVEGEFRLQPGAGTLGVGDQEIVGRLAGLRVDTLEAR